MNIFLFRLFLSENIYLPSISFRSTYFDSNILEFYPHKITVQKFTFQILDNLNEIKFGLKYYRHVNFNLTCFFLLLFNLTSKKIVHLPIIKKLWKNVNITQHNCNHLFMMVNCNFRLLIDLHHTEYRFLVFFHRPKLSYLFVSLE